MDPHLVESLVPDEPPAVRLMDTVYARRSQVHDSLTTAEELRRFLAPLPGAPARCTGADLAAARRLRDALRRLAADVTADDRPAARAAGPALSERAAVAAVNAALAAAPPPVLRRTPAGWSFDAVRGRSVAGVLADLAAEGAALFADPERPLRACNAPGCVLYFVKDHPRREWCGIACGNRARAARHYARVRGRR